MRSTCNATTFPTNSDAYIPVRVADAPRPDGSMIVYLPDGTALVVNSRHVLRVDPRTATERSG
jgi:hypothetical protein